MEVFKGQTHCYSSFFKYEIKLVVWWQSSDVIASCVCECVGVGVGAQCASSNECVGECVPYLCMSSMCEGVCLRESECVRECECVSHFICVNSLQCHRKHFVK